MKTHLYKQFPQCSVEMVSTASSNVEQKGSCISSIHGETVVVKTFKVTGP